MLSGDENWEGLHPLICRFHDPKCHTDWLSEHGLSAGPDKMDRGSKCFRSAPRAIDPSRIT